MLLQSRMYGSKLLISEANFGSYGLISFSISVHSILPCEIWSRRICKFEAVFLVRKCTKDFTFGSMVKLMKNCDKSMVSKKLSNDRLNQLSRPYFVPHSCVMIFLKISIIKCFKLINIQLVSRPYIASIFHLGL